MKAGLQLVQVTLGLREQRVAQMPQLLLFAATVKLQQFQKLPTLLEKA